MNKSQLKQAVKIGRKWAIISTVFGVMSALAVWFYTYNYSSFQMFKQPYFYIGLLSAFTSALYIGEIAVINYLEKGDDIIQIWVLLGFVTSVLSIIQPLTLISKSILEYFQNFGVGLLVITIIS